jgi:DNA-binding transcriptional ArsR family regulator
MVVSRNGREEHADRIFRALADRTRRDIVRRAMSGTLSVSGLARLYPMSTTAVQKHVAVLEEAGLVLRTRRGREQLVQTRIDTIAEARRVLGELEQLWRERLERIGDVIAEPERGESS